MDIVVTRLQNIGDMLVFIPALRLLRQALPQARITLLAKHAQGVEIVERCPFIDSTLRIESPGFFEKLRILREFRRLKPELFIVSPQDQGKVPWAVLGGARRIAAFKSVLQRGEIKREKLAFMIDAAPEFDAAKSETENSLVLVSEALKAIGAKTPERPDAKLEYSWIKPESEAGAEAAAKAAGLDPAKPFAAVALFSKGAHKNWPLERFEALLAELAETHGLPSALLGGAKDKDACEAVAAKLKGKAFNLAGSLSLDESASLLARAKLYAGNDSGPSHLASAVGAPALVFYRKESHVRWRLPDSKAPRIELVAEGNDIREIGLEAAKAACGKLLEGASR